MDALTITEINKALKDDQWFYHHELPHNGVGLETPISYYQPLKQNTRCVS